MVKAEFHCHTCYSKDSQVTIQDLIDICQRKGIQRLVVTDHNTIEGALEAHALYPGMFIVGEEIMTTQGELLGFFMKESIPRGLSPLETINILRSQGAFISVSHPFDAFRRGRWEPENLIKIVPYLDAIEIFNSRCMFSRFNTRAKEFAQQHHLLGTVGSDSHHIREVGTATLTLPDFIDAASLKTSLALAQPHLKLSAPWVHFYSRQAARQKRGLK
jgi:predicted metal-dependent phosphoesterase TrpH